MDKVDDEDKKKDDVARAKELLGGNRVGDKNKDGEGMDEESLSPSDDDESEDFDGE